MRFADARDGLAAAYQGVDRLVAGLSRTDLLAGTRCRGWLVADVLFHLLNDAQRALVALASPVPGPSDVDYVGYWRAFAADAGPEHDPVPDIWSIRRSAASHRDGVGTTLLWLDTSPAVVRAAGAANPDGFVTTQGHVLRVPDLLATLATEAAVHHLDLIVDLPRAPRPEMAALAVAVSTLDGLAGAPRPSAWSVEEYVLKATGRAPLSGADHVDGYPLLG